MIQTQGNYHVCFKDVPKSELKYIEENAQIESYFLTNSLGYAKLDNSKNDPIQYELKDIQEIKKRNSFFHSPTLRTNCHCQLFR